MASWKKRPVAELDRWLKMDESLLSQMGTPRRQQPPCNRQPASPSSSRLFLGSTPKPKPQPSKRKLQIRRNLDGSVLPAHLRLKAQKVGQTTLNRYLTEIAHFDQWLQSRGQRRQPSRLDRQVTLYLTHLSENTDTAPAAASYLVFGLQLLHNDGPKGDFLPSSKEALAGWKKQSPGSTRWPVPEEFTWDLAHYFLQAENVEVAMALVLQQHCYLRPSEVLTLTRKHVSFPARGRYRKWGLLLAPDSLGQRTKTGQTDDTVMIGDIPSTVWVSECFALYIANITDELFPNTTLNKYERLMTLALKDLQYAAGTMTPHTLRHAGPSNDLFHERRDLTAFQKRGRWKTKESVRRYEKSGLLVKRWEACAPRRKALVAAHSQTFPSVLKQALRNRKPVHNSG